MVPDTFFERHSERLVTYYDLGATPMEKINLTRYTETDRTLVARDWQDTVVAVNSCREPGLQSHHYLVLIDLVLDIPRRHSCDRYAKREMAALDVPSVA